MKKLEAYKQAKADFEFAQETVETMRKVLDSYEPICINSNINISATSSDKQYVYAISILNNQIKACEELSIDCKEYEEAKATVLKIRLVSKDLNAWDRYLSELYRYQKDIYNLLDKDDLFQLLEAPVKP